MEYTREEWYECFPGQAYPGDTTDEEMDNILSMIESPEELEEE
jgi:hypothetical protein